ncbi:rhodanese [Leptolyngbya valderiana BDU 20041]|nr:rhodanese-like domain-containing protein [Geitlerinema sp. CS-897]OAB63515.1 rhodanese [Leptolyngbya valderiana BDU 20041]PPT09478.1 Zn-dependent hydroxyacylglutathione hydrolase / Polysulfide binding protein [Geitlerinema sp. FC II]
MSRRVKKSPKLKYLSPAQLESRQERLEVVDIRGLIEYMFGHVPGAKRMSLTRILKEIPKDQALVVTCLSGMRSQSIANILVQKGYQNVYNLQGGCMAWQRAGYALKAGL